MKKLYEFHWDCGRQGDLSGLFIAEDSDLEDLMGNEIYFGEVLGKHSEVYGTLEVTDCKVISEDESFIAKLAEVLKIESTVSGYNPFDYYDPEDEEDDDDDES
jgi:hypothetical protein